MLAMRKVNQYVRQMNEAILFVCGVPATLNLKVYNWNDNTRAGFQKLGIETLGDLIAYPRKGFMQLSGCGINGLRDIDKFLEGLGITTWV